LQNARQNENLFAMGLQIKCLNQDFPDFKIFRIFLSSESFNPVNPDSNNERIKNNGNINT